MNETRRSILAALEDGPVGGPELADSLGVSRAAVWKHVEALRNAGFEIESGPGGYELAAVTAYNGPAVEYGLDAPFEVEYHESVTSTNDRARELAAAGETDVAVLADEQTGGRGRLERPWSAPAGGVWVSVLCRPQVTPARAPLFTLAAAVAVTRAAREAGVDAQIKWPNDVIVPGARDRTDATGSTTESAVEPTAESTASETPPYRKLAGILTEMEGETDRIEWLAVGIGVNANVDTEALPETATSIRAEAGDVDRRRFVQRLLEEFHRERTDLDGIVDAWREVAATIGQRVRVDRGGEPVVGDAVDVTDAGALVVETGNGRVTVAAGDCEHLRPV